jgi:hypothetical protein
MRIEHPRVPLQVRVGKNGEMAYRVGYAQFLTMRLMRVLKPGEQPPEGLITPTGILRKHIPNDLWPSGLVEARRVSEGHMEYRISKTGAGVLDDPKTVVTGKPRTAEQRTEARNIEKTINLLERQRLRKARRAAAQEGQGSRRTTAA